MKKNLDIERGKLSMDKAEKILRMIEEKSTMVFLPIIGREKGGLLGSIVKSEQPHKILEIGTLVGYSAILMASNQEKGSITCIEISEKFSEIAKKHIKKAGFENIKIVTGDALDVIPKLKEKYDLVFIDAAKESYFDYLQMLEKNKNLKEGSIIVADNVKIFKKEVEDYLEHVRKSGYYQSQHFDFGNDGVEVSIKL